MAARMCGTPYLSRRTSTAAFSPRAARVPFVCGNEARTMETMRAKGGDEDKQRPQADEELLRGSYHDGGLRE